MIVFDQNLFLWINGLAGHIGFIDDIFKGLASDYFFIVATGLVLVALWFGVREANLRQKTQKIVLAALASIGITQVFVIILNAIFTRTRPFDELTVNLLFYQPTDSSFPSNAIAIVTAAAVAVFFINRKAGWLLICFVALYSLARVYVGIHYPLDVLGGAAIGGFTALLMVGLFKLIEPLSSLVLKLLRNLYMA